MEKKEYEMPNIKIIEAKIEPMLYGSVDPSSGSVRIEDTDDGWDDDTWDPTEVSNKEYNAVRANIWGRSSLWD